MNRTEIIRGMAEALWASVGGLRRDTPPPASQAAGDLANIYEAVNGTSLEDLAHQIPTSILDASDSPGMLLALYATGAHEPPPGLEVPAFEVHMDGDELVWDGEAKSVTKANPVRRRNAGRPGDREYRVERTDPATEETKVLWVAARSADEAEYAARAREPFKRYQMVVSLDANGEPITRPAGERRNPGETGSVLVVEDDPNLQKMYPRLLRKMYPGAEVFVVDNYDAAVGYLNAHPGIGLIISDVDIVGDKSGVDVFEWVKGNRPDLVDRYVFITGGNPHVAKLHYRFVEKPATPDQIRQAILQPAP